MRNAEFTGRYRHHSWKGRLILQVEERCTFTHMDCGFVETDRVLRWRDATIADLTVGFMTPAGLVGQGSVG